jgi:DNA-binding CsgD family transcriptional regulator
MLCPALVGRRLELEAMTRVLDVAGGAVAVLGEAGIGKSRLIRQLCGLARDRGWVVVTGRAVQARRPLPYRPLAEALITACRRSGLPDDAQLVPYRAALGRLLPEWHRPELAGSAESTVVLAEGVLRLLKALGGDAGLLLAVEDLHWADPETLDVLDYVVDHALEERLAVVVTARPGSPAGTTLLHDLVDRRAASLVELAPLSSSEVASMAGAALDTATLPAGLSELLARAEGVPFLVEELLAAAVAAGVLVRQEPGWTLQSSATALIPGSFVDAVARRLEALPCGEREVVHLAALLGRIDPTLLASTIGRSPERTVEVLLRAVDLQLVTVDDAVFRFRHALTRDAVLAGLLPDTRMVLARRARSALERLHPGLPGRWCGVAAELSQLAGDPEDAATLLLTAGARALAAGALTTAADVLGQARALAQTGSPVALDIDETRARVAGLRGDVDTAFACSRRLLQDVTEPARRARINLQMAEAASEATRWTVAQKELAAARPLAADEAARARIDALTAHVLLGAARIAEAEPTACHAWEAAERIDLGDTACQALEVLGRIARTRSLAEAEMVFTRQLEVAARHGLALWEVRATHELGTIDLLRANRTDRLTRARELAIQAGVLSTTATIDLQLSGSGYLAFDAAACLGPARRCQDTARRFHLDLLLAEALQLEAAAHAFAGRRAAMEWAIAEARATGRPEPDLEANAWAHRAEFALLREDRKAAVAAYDTAISILRQAATVYSRPYWLMWALLRTVQDEGGDEARAEARQHGQDDNSLWAAILGYADAVAAGRRGDPAEANQLFQAARSRVQAAGLAAQRHLAERLVAECALTDGWGDPTRWLTEAAGFFRDSGHVHLERACRSLLRRAGVRLPRREHGHRTVSPPLAAMGITDREAEVLALVVQGLSSRQIASRLFISARTVDKHVERLLVKTGQPRRSDLRQFSTYPTPQQYAFSALWDDAADANTGAGTSAEEDPLRSSP